MSKSQKDQNSINDLREEDSISKQYLNRKKKRDSNISSEILEPIIPLNNEIRCSICLGYEKLVPNCFKCILCSSYFHLECYNLFKLPETKENILKEENLPNFECFRCKEEKILSKNITCYLCKNHNGITKKLENDKYLHHYCYVFFKDSLMNKGGGSCKNCSHKKIPVLKCQETKCKDKYHIQCAIDKQIIFWLPFMREEDKINKEKFNDKILFFCETHNEDLIKNYNDYYTTMLLSKNDKNEEPINNNNISTNNLEKNLEIKNNDKNNSEIIPQKMPESESNNIPNEQKSIKEEKKIENNDMNEKDKKKEKDKNNENTTPNINLHIGINTNNNLNTNEKEKEQKKEEIKEKEEENADNLEENDEKDKNQKDSSNTPVKIDLSKHPSRINSSNNKLSNSNNDIINVIIKEKEKEKMEEDEVDININLDNKMNSEENEEDEDEDMEIDNPEIKHEDMNLFEIFKNRNEKFLISGSYYKHY